MILAILIPVPVPTKWPEVAPKPGPQIIVVIVIKSTPAMVAWIVLAVIVNGLMARGHAWMTPAIQIPVPGKTKLPEAVPRSGPQTMVVIVTMVTPGSETAV